MRFKWYVFVMMVVLTGLVVFLTGLDTYIYSRTKINILPVNDRKSAIEKLKGITGANQHRGLLGFANELGWGGVMIWQVDGPRYYRADEHTVFAYWDGCNLNEPIDLQNTDGVIPKEVYTDVGEWVAKARKGDLITIVESTGNYEIEKGKLREVWAIDWWSFLPGNMETQCRR